jgi:hypothetical protein
MVLPSGRRAVLLAKRAALPLAQGLAFRATYEHTFPDAGTFEYLNEFGFPDEGRVIIEP